MPVPTAEQVNAILERLKQAVTDGTREPTAILTAEEHRVMLDLHLHDPMAAGVVLQHLREHARTVDGWRNVEIRAINFRLYVAGAREARRREQAIEQATNVVRLGVQRGARRARERNHSVSGEVPVSEGMSPAQMVETESTRLIALGLLRTQRNGRIWYDTFHKRVFSDWRGDHDGTTIDAEPVTDAFADRVTTWLHQNDSRLSRLNELQVQRLVQHVAHHDLRNEPRDWLLSRVWDGEARLPGLLSRGFGAHDTRFNREAGRCWFVSMVARIMEPGCKVDTMPVFIGGQGKTKSQALEVIGGKWYRAASSGIDGKDFLMELHGALVFEIPELHSLLASRHGADRTKAVISTRIDHFRVPFGRLAEDHKRTAVFAGTTNRRDWHNDDTGGRRYWPVHVGQIDLSWLADMREQLFAEAYAYYQRRLTILEMQEGTGPEGHTQETQESLARGQWWNVPDDEQAELIEAETAEHPWQEMIEPKLNDATLYRGALGQVATPWDGTIGEATDWGNIVTVTRIGVQWLRLNPDALGRGTQATKTISAIMRKLGWELKRTRVRGMLSAPKVWTHPESIGNRIQEIADNAREASRIDDEDVPF